MEKTIIDLTNEVLKDQIIDLTEISQDTSTTEKLSYPESIEISIEGKIQPLEQRSQRCPWCMETLWATEEIGTYAGNNKLYFGWMCHEKCNLANTGKSKDTKSKDTQSKNNPKNSYTKDTQSKDATKQSYSEYADDGEI